ncbi:N-acetyltransferase family protein [Algiphilus sp.]|uniref:GNAT family N-acetyltransferase n=1 Tax=Algiphilus sp. TaxID=1872431 RepID=UPI003C4D983B
MPGAVARIRPAAPADIDDLLGLIRALAVYERLEHELDLEPTRMVDAMFGRRPFVEGLVAVVDDDDAPNAGKTVGCALCFKSFSTFLTRPGLYLEDLFVLPDYRGRGIGLALLRAVCAQAAARGYGRVEWSVLDWNAPAIAFYRRLGAVHHPEWQRFRLEGASLEQVAAQMDAPGG